MQEYGGRCEEDAWRSFEIQGGAWRNRETSGLRWTEIRECTGKYEGGTGRYGKVRGDIKGEIFDAVAGIERV